MPNALYLFCLARGRLVPFLDGTGITGSEMLIMKDFSNVTAVVCEVPEDEFSGSSAETNLQDLGWVGLRAVRHEQVVEEVMRYSPVLPARFGSLFSSLENLASLVESNIAAINMFLDHVADKEEWSVKGSLSKTKALEEIFFNKLKGMSESFSSLSPGMRYFKERQIRAEAEKELAGWVKKACNTVSEELIGLCASSRQRKIISLSKEESDKQTVVNWAFLLDHSLVGDFLKGVDSANARYNSKGLFFECSGPWPPYSFCPSLESESDA
ncbi:MAG: GvpL/GvpF family gas vesicle protein [Desulfomonile tiedjei]|uniref:GvpL/GvpF family gas vesicle protein n=1 Tax=Desulfomonile tiedjei TaxID=2358 RepID=A0A9D6V5V1_9BACT|nr:GvpL/GvpF family gas vesicle protein [Desulfomonile tiedjei]